MGESAVIGYPNNQWFLQFDSFSSRQRAEKWKYMSIDDEFPDLISRR
jgi:hypothetical protein